MTAPKAVGGDRTGHQPQSLTVAPCRENGHVPATCPCLSAGRWCHGFHAATLDQDLLTAWWQVNPGFGAAVSCGPARLVVIDVDTTPMPSPPGTGSCLASRSTSRSPSRDCPRATTASPCWWLFMACASLCAPSSSPATAWTKPASSS
ncbi:bifunctional DNA primase/polymerase [Kitasatospora sp. NPDC057541]|uniref:bifunctional DNA primase/polymerase n=1 Tax=unclassified Kitasatospora TaxID=2633591 RepID=UPI0036AAF406